ncbi:DUF5682 family protein [Nocardioides sp. C4-1]|uniref:DUF5682 family protein n=1 Tax=Nocardioides sp. C4-1 TaxID=3151851 RepID=UPI00326678EC
MTVSPVTVLGVRHHGPGSARSVRAALDELAPDVVVIEGAPELDPLAALVADVDLVPPVAALVYVVDTPRRASFYPIAAFSPEWVALRWAAAHGVPVRFADLPAVHALADQTPSDDGPDDAAPSGPRTDPITALARAAGYDDAERWWEDAVEHRTTSTLGGFDLLREAMASVREHDPHDVENERREAAMRRVLRAVLKDGAERVVLVCGAYHAPAVHPDAWPPASHDTRLLTRLPRVKVAATWVPWSAGRLATASGYGAGVTAPGWYHHLFVTDEPDEVVPGWLTRVARELRAEGYGAAPATVVEAVRLAEALAAIRARPSVGLSELDDAGEVVLCEGSRLPMRAVHDRLVVGQEIGRVPDSVPLTPLAQDLARQQRSLKLKATTTPTEVVLDLRTPNGRARSILLHRLRLLDVPWGRPADAGRSTGTFKEAWLLAWEPELAVALIEAGLHGTTVVAAADAKARADAEAAPDLATLGALVEVCLTAELGEGLAAVVDTLAERTARQHDTLALLGAVEPLARTRRYGDVRGADTSRVAGVLDTVVTRASVGLRAACVNLDDDGAAAMRAAVDAAHRGIALLDVADLSRPWRTALGAAAADDRVAPLVSGRANRILLDLGEIGSDDVAPRMSRRLSRAADAVAGAAWVDGFLDGDAVLLVHDATLLGLVDAWVAGVGEESFEDVLPLLRRTFARFEPPERRQIGERLRHGDRPRAAGVEVDDGRGRPAARRVAELLGLAVTA